MVWLIIIHVLSAVLVMHPTANRLLQLLNDSQTEVLQKPSAVMIGLHARIRNLLCPTSAKPHGEESET